MNTEEWQEIDSYYLSIGKYTYLFYKTKWYEFSKRKLHKWAIKKIIEAITEKTSQLK